MKSFLKIFVVSIFLGLLLPVFVFAQNPGIPHQFYGTVTFSEGTITDGLMVEAKIGETVVGTSATSDGKYGYNPDLLFATDSQNTNAGETIKFYVSGIKATETATFVTGESTNLNLTVSGTVGTINVADEDATIEDEVMVVGPTQPANIQLGNSLNINVSSGSNTSALVNKIEKLSSTFFTGSTAIIAGNNLLNAFEINITGDDLTISISITYNDADIDEDTIKPYRFDGTSWVEISGFTINKTANIITFSISSAETPYAIFGEESQPVSTSGGGGGGGGGSYIPPVASTKGDINNDNKVDKYDFSLMMANWGKTGSNGSDLNGDNKVDKYDFSLLMLNWSK